jgi:hypothetical protein
LKNGDSYTVKYNITGEGAAIGAPEISTESTVDVGTSQVAGFVMSKEIGVKNIGQSPLQILQITGLNATDFRQVNNCDGSATLIQPGDSCTILVSYTANDFSP